jgi:hypothetical protein
MMSRQYMKQTFGLVVASCLTIIVDLLIVGAVSSGVIRHVVQTSPLWIAIVLGARRSHWVKWAAFPCFVFWFLLMAAIWFFLLGWAHFVSGTFSSMETIMTVMVGLASLTGVVGASRVRSSARFWAAVSTVLLVAGLQITAFRLSLLPAIAHH